MARARRPLTLVIGYFDPYLAAHARQLQELKAAAPDATLAIALEYLAGSLLPLEARAEMMAALSVVDLVTMGNTETLHAESTIDLRAEHAGFSKALRAHVLNRCREPAR